MKKIFVFILTVIILLSCTVTAFADYTSLVDSEENVEIRSSCVFMKSLDDGTTVIYEKNADTKKDPASLAKIVVGILVLRECEDLSQKVTVEQKSLDTVNGTGWGVMNLREGETVSVRDLLYCTVMANANDTCFVLVDEILGGTEACVQKMNEYVRSLGCENTNFTNPNGIASPEQYTTCRDMVTIYSDCVKNASFREIVGSNTYEMEPTNKYDYTRTAYTTYLPLTSSGYSNKYTNGGRYAGTETGNCNVVCTSSYEGYNYVVCVLDAPIEEEDGGTYRRALSDAKRLFTWVHTKIKLRTLVSTDTYCGEAKVKYSSKYDYVTLYPEKTITTLVPETIDQTSLLIEIDKSTLPDEITKTIKKGDIVCQAKIIYADTVLAEINLVAGFDVQKNPLKIITSGLSGIAHSIVFKVFIYFVFCLIILLAVVFIIKNRYEKETDTKKRRTTHKNDN